METRRRCSRSGPKNSITSSGSSSKIGISSPVFKWTIDSIRFPVKRMRTGTPSLCLEGMVKSWRKSFTTDADVYSSPLFRGLLTNCRYPRRRSFSLKSVRFICCPGYRRVVSENTFDGIRHRRPENRWSIWDERCQQYKSITPPMRAASGSSHLNNRFKTTPMDRFFFVIFADNAEQRIASIRVLDYRPHQAFK